MVTYFLDENDMKSFNGNYIDLTRTWEIFFTMVHYFKKKAKFVSYFSKKNLLHMNDNKFPEMTCFACQNTAYISMDFFMSINKVFDFISI